MFYEPFYVFSEIGKSWSFPIFNIAILFLPGTHTILQQYRILWTENCKICSKSLMFIALGHIVLLGFYLLRKQCLI